MHIRHFRILLVLTSSPVRPVRPDALHTSGIVQRWYSIPWYIQSRRDMKPTILGALSPSSGRYASSSHWVRLLCSSKSSSSSHFPGRYTFLSRPRDVAFDYLTPYPEIILSLSHRSIQHYRLFSTFQYLAFISSPMSRALGLFISRDYWIFPIVQGCILAVHPCIKNSRG